MTKIGHNSEKTTDRIQALAVRYAKADEQSMALNDERAEIREEIKDMGFDTKAWQDEIKRAKNSLKKREGYDESASVIRSAIGKMDMEDLFEHVLRREREKEQAREAKKAEKAKDDEYKPAAERKPKAGKVISGKDAAAGEKADDEPSVGEQQAAAYNAAHGTQTVN